MESRNGILGCFILCLLALSLTASAAVTDPNIITEILRSNSSATFPVVDNGGLEVGALSHVDRSFLITDNDDLVGIDYVQTAVDDKADPDVKYIVRVDKAGTLFLLIDNRVGDDNGADPPTLGGGVMDWVITDGFTETGYVIEVNGDTNFTTWALDIDGIDPNTVLDEQNDGTSRLMYMIAAIPDGWNLPPSVTGVPVSAQLLIGESLVIDSTIMDYGEDTTTTVLWEKISGDDPVTFDPCTTYEDVTVSFPEGGEGDYTLRMTVTDGDGSQTIKTIEVSVQYPSFAVERTNWCTACNDPDVGPNNTRVRSSRHHARNHSAPRRRIEYVQYDISGIKDSSEAFFDCYFTLNVDKRHTNKVLSVFALNEDNDNVNLDSGTWNSLPGVVNNPAPPQSEPITMATLEHGEITPLLLAEPPDIPLDVWHDTTTSVGLDEFLNADTDGTITLMFLTFSPEDADFEIRSTSTEPETGKDGIVLRGKVTTSTWATNPSPQINSEQPTNLSELSWTNPSGLGNITCDVYIGTADPCYLYPDYGYDTLTTNDPCEFVSLSGYTLTVDNTYNWIVDCTDSGTGVKTRGHLWNFDVVSNIAPTVSVNAPQYLWLNNNGDPGSAHMELETTVEDEFPELLTYLWEQVGNEPVPVAIDPNDVVDLILDLPATGTYTFRVTVDDGELKGYASAEVYVGTDACDAAQHKPEYVQIIADLYHDCFVDLKDLAEFAIHWLECNVAMDAPCVE